MRNPNAPKQVTVNGKNYNSYNSLGHVFEFSLMSDAGWVKLGDWSFGSESLYFTFKADDGFEYDGFCKCL